MYSYSTQQHPDNPESTLKNKQCKAVLEKKLETAKQLNAEIFAMETKIEQTDVFKEKVLRAIIDATGTISTKEAQISERPSIVTSSPVLPAATI